MALTKAEGRELMKQFVAFGLTAADLSMRERIDAEANKLGPSYVVTHEPTSSEIIMTGPVPEGSTSALRTGAWSGSRRLGTEPATTWRANNWTDALGYAGGWASEVAEWAVTPDVWALDTATLPDAADNSPFTQPERDEIAKQLDEITGYVREHFELRDDQLAALGQTVEELKEASERVGRKDWKLMFYGAFISLGLEHAVQSGVVEAMFRLAVQGLGHLFGAGSPPIITA